MKLFHSNNSKRPRIKYTDPRKIPKTLNKKIRKIIKNKRPHEKLHLK